MEEPKSCDTSFIRIPVRTEMLSDLKLQFLLLLINPMLTPFILNLQNFIQVTFQPSVQQTSWYGTDT